MPLETLGPYDLLTCLTAGGMAEIYAARDRRDPTQLVIVKRMLAQYIDEPAFVEMFLDEGRTVSLLRHPNIVRMHYFGFEGDTPYLAMEYLHGVDVRSMMRAARAQRATLTLEIALAIASAVCAGLHHAHEAKSVDGYPLEIVHRDVSPQNVFVTFLGAVKVIDFGIAKSRGRSHETRAGALKGKVPYMSPEQIRGTGVDRRSDIYAVGVMLYELVAGRRPYVLEAGEPQGEFSLMMAIVSHQIAAPRTVRPSIPAAVEQIILKALSAQPSERYQTAEEMLHALTAVARAEGLRCDAQALIAFLEVAFGDEKRQWQATLTDNDDELVTRIEELLEQLRSSPSEDLDPTALTAAELAGLDAPPPLLASAGIPPPPKRSLDDVTLLTLEPRLDEHFRGRERAAALSGSVILDLSEVVRVSALGMRQWEEFQHAVQARGEEVALYLARCAEVTVAQLGLVRTLAEGCHVASFLAPYACARCGYTFRHTFDCERDAAALRAATLPQLRCPSCQGPASLDDDPAFLAPLRAHLGRPLPAAVRAVLERPDSAPPLVEKHIEHERTRVRFARPIDRGFRWARLLDGLEGDLELELTAAGLTEAGAVDAAANALRDLGPEVRSVQLVGAPAALALQLAHQPRCIVRSVAVRGSCPSCRTPRWTSLGSGEFADLRAGSSPASAVPTCHRCASPLRELERDGPPAARPIEDASHPRAASPDASTPAPPPRPAPPISAPDGRAARWAWRSGVAAAGIALGLGTMWLSTRDGDRAGEPAPALPGKPLPSTAPSPAASAADVVEVEAEARAPTPAAALTQTRRLATRALIAKIEAQLPDDLRGLGAETSVDDVLEHVAAQLGPQLAITQTAVTPSANGKLSARYAIRRAEFEAATAFYRERLTAWDATLGNAPPALPPGVIVVTSSSASLRPGDRILSLGDTQVRSIRALHQALAAHSAGDVVLTSIADRAGARRRLALPTPAPLPAPSSASCNPERSSTCHREP